ncbi:pseudouridine synthase [Polynucleobacter necessarius]|uniref:pseudouridine synthase n=1 Tax=Polynucleobacter necessarius TaxID=576610 RepID=UPI001E55DEFD|nr:pseudouridine synthase [Polynucleobacter necessarius]
MSIQVNSEGVLASRVFLPADQSHPNLLQFFIAQFPHIQAKEWAQRFEDGLILDIEGRSLSGTDPYLPNTHLMYFRSLVREPEIPFEEEIIYQDEHILVADKPHFLPVTPSGLYLHQTLLNRLRKKTQISSLSPVHRIDRDTAGLVIFSIIPQERAQYQNLFRDRAVKKVYEAIAPFSRALVDQLPMTYTSRLEESEHFLQMQEVAGDPNTDTLIELIEQKGAMARYRLSPGSGKKHQLRCHLNALGIPIRNDQIYPILTPYQKYELDFSKPLQLLAKELEFQDPVAGEKRAFQSKQSL